MTGIGKGRVAAILVECCSRIYSGWKCMMFVLNPVHSELKFICTVDALTLDRMWLSTFSWNLQMNWPGPLALRLRPHSKDTFTINLPTSVNIPFRKRLALTII